MKPMRLRINTDIVTEFLPPHRGNGDQAIIFCDGMPSVPAKRHVLEYWSKKGYWVFHPRYKGTWESTGTFLDHDPTIDIIEVARTIRSGELMQIRPHVSQMENPRIRKISIIGASFGGSVALLTSLHPEIDKVVAISPVIDWAKELENTVESLSDLRVYLRDGFGGAYRFSDSDFNRLGNDPQFFNPIAHVSEYDPRKLFIMHAKDDMIVSQTAVENFIKTVKCSYRLREYGGHLSSSVSIAPIVGLPIRRFISH